MCVYWFFYRTEYVTKQHNTHSLRCRRRHRHRKGDAGSNGSVIVWSFSGDGVVVVAASFSSLFFYLTRFCRHHCMFS